MPEVFQEKTLAATNTLLKYNEQITTLKTQIIEQET